AAEAAGRWRLDDCTLVVTLEPCAMCAGAAVGARIARVVFGAFDDKAGAVGSVWDLLRDRAALHHPEVTSVVRAEESRGLLRGFFADRRLCRLAAVAHLTESRFGGRKCSAVQLSAVACPSGRRCDTRKDRKSTRLNSSHVSISYAVFCLKKKILINYKNFRRFISSHYYR